ncbi:hypothetical protein GCM10011321_31460 [Youhaiella tibetensis]|uniref:Phage tail protein n=1 Tax=Paradevosia tibetensis TaxID=1447062 RepID=A0A5B9DIJ3_9HYPH|nr:phage tail protein [Youhaiella tibetensis]QEE18893.1 phage tail protein [Youhaiella tibetensis]GGF38221.1 hypothetical protein GCM10011321_31460 [Youhaiella tibetensis]
MTSALLPTNATPWERVLADAMLIPPVVSSAITAMRRVKYVSPRPSMLPYLVWEYGLGELTPYVPNLYNLIDQGVRWQRLRGTVSAVAVGLAWVGYSATLEEAWTGRRFWNSFQLRFPSLPVRDLPDLEQIEGVTGLSVPKRSILRRGVFQYNVGAVEAESTRLDTSLLDHESGVAVTQAGTIWSFGRTHSFDHTLSEAEGQTIGNWLEPVEGGPLLWMSIETPWEEAEFAWDEDAASQRQSVMAGWFVGQAIHLRLADAEGATIGYRRCRAVRAVRLEFDGAYAFGADTYNPLPGGGLLYLEAMTQFGDASEITCGRISVLVGAARAAGVTPGRLWLEPDELVGGNEIAEQVVDIPLRATVREQFKILMRF